jgi:hypothetical protein
MMSQEKENVNIWDQIVARCWTDETFKAKFLAAPATVLKEYGLQAPVGLKVLENTAEVNYLVLPANPAALSNEELNGVAGGSNWYVNNRPVVT